MVASYDVLKLAGFPSKNNQIHTHLLPSLYFNKNTLEN